MGWVRITASEPTILLRNTEHPADPDRSGACTAHACRRWFLQLYSDYRDDRLDHDTRAAVIAHMAECAPCRRYDRVIRTGVAVLRDSLRKHPEALVDRRESPVDRWPFERGGYSRPAITGLTASATLLVIALNVASGWSPRPARDVPEPRRPPVAAVAPPRAEAPVHFPLPPLVRIPHAGRGPAEVERDTRLEFRKESDRVRTRGSGVAQEDPD